MRHESFTAEVHTDGREVKGSERSVERLSLDVLNPGPIQESYPLRFFT